MSPNAEKVKASAAAIRKKDGHVGGTSVNMKKPNDMNADAAGSASSTSGDAFARSVSLMAVAHIARGVGFDAVQSSAAEALTDILGHYIRRIGVATKDIAELAGRAQAQATDVTQALSDLVPAPVELKDLVKALETTRRPFPRDVPAFPVRKRDLSGSAIEQTTIGNREQLPPHVPSFLPPMPNRHTYSSESKVVVEREHDTKRVRLDLLNQKSQVQQSLHGLQTVTVEKQAPVVHQPSWNAFQGAMGESALDNPFVQPAVVLSATHSNSAATDPKNVFAQPEREFAPNASSQKAQKKHHMESIVSIPKLANNQELGKEEKILTGTFHDGDSE